MEIRASRINCFAIGFEDIGGAEGLLWRVGRVPHISVVSARFLSTAPSVAKDSEKGFGAGSGKSSSSQRVLHLTCSVIVPTVR